MQLWEGGSQASRPTGSVNRHISEPSLGPASWQLQALKTVSRRVEQAEPSPHPNLPPFKGRALSWGGASQGNLSHLLCVRLNPNTSGG